MRVLSELLLVQLLLTAFSAATARADEPMLPIAHAVSPQIYAAAVNGDLVATTGFGTLAFLRFTGDALAPLGYLERSRTHHVAALALDRDHAWLRTDAGLELVDASDPHTPRSVRVGLFAEGLEHFAVVPTEAPGRHRLALITRRCPHGVLFVATDAVGEVTGEQCVPLFDAPENYEVERADFIFEGSRLYLALKLNRNGFRYGGYVFPLDVDATAPAATLAGAPFHIKGYFEGVTARDGVVYVAARRDEISGRARMHALRWSTSGPVVLSEVELPADMAWPDSLHTIGRYLIAEIDGRLLRVFDLADPAHPLMVAVPVKLDEARLFGGKDRLVAAGNRLLRVASSSRTPKLVVYAFDDGPMPVAVAERPMVDNLLDFTVRGDGVAAIGDSSGLLSTVDLSDPAHVRELGALRLEGALYRVTFLDERTAVALSRPSAFSPPGSGFHLYLVDLSDPRRPALRAKLRLDYTPYLSNLVVAGDLIYVVDTTTRAYRVAGDTLAPAGTYRQPPTGGFGVETNAAAGDYFVLMHKRFLVYANDGAAEPQPLADLELPCQDAVPAVAGSTLWVSCGFQRRLLSYDLADPRAPRLVADVAVDHTVLAFRLTDFRVDQTGTTLTAHNDTRLLELDITDPAAPRVKRAVTLEPPRRDVTRSILRTARGNGYVFALWDSGLLAYRAE